MRAERRSCTDRAALDLSAEEPAFLDPVATRYGPEYDPVPLRGLVPDVVLTQKAGGLGGDRPWVVADLRAAGGRTLRKRGVKVEHADPLADRVLEQAGHIFATRPEQAV